MKFLSAAFAAAIAAATLGLPAMAGAQVGPDAHQPMPSDQVHRGEMRPGDMNQGAMRPGDARDDMHQGDARTGAMHGDAPSGNMRGNDMHGGDVRGGGMGGDHMRGGMGHHGMHGRCHMMRRHHRHVRVCR